MFAEDDSGCSDVLDCVKGVWKSDEDSNYSIEIREDGSIFEIYAGEVGESGHWDIIRVGDDTHLVETLNGEKYEYVILDVDSEHLKLSYMPRGNTLSFTRSF